MTTYRELAWALDTYGEDDKQRDQIAAILRSLDAQRPTVNSVMYLIQQYVGKKGAQKEENAAQCLAEIQALVEALAAPVAAQPLFEKGSWQHAVDDQLVSFGRTSQEFESPHDAVRWLIEQEVLAARPQQAKPEPLSDAEFAINMLEMMFTAYENGVPCYEDPEDEVGFIGYAVRLADDDFKNIGDFLNRVRPVQSGIKEQG